MPIAGATDGGVLLSQTSLPRLFTQ